MRTVILVINIVNTVCLEQFDDNGDGFHPARIDLEPSPKRARMERQIRFYKKKKQEQDTIILSVHARECLNKIDKSVQSPAKITSPRASTTALIKWKEITPQEKKRRIKTKGEQFMK